jgi:hypothetical protein
MIISFDQNKIDFRLVEKLGRADHSARPQLRLPDGRKRIREAGTLATGIPVSH